MIFHCLSRFGFVLCLAASAVVSAQTKLLRFPDIQGERVVFTYAGDLWTASKNGGSATRLTAHPGLELFPKFSPDGRWVAFTGQYDGDEQVYVIPADGGVPRQLTFYPARGPLPPRWGYDNQVYGFTRDGQSVLFRSMREGWDLTDTRLYTVSIGGGLPVALPMPVSGGGDLSPDGTKAVYSPLTRDFRTWKRYEGGWAQDLYIFDLNSAAITPVAHSKRTERDPMWIGDEIWFASDRDGTLNLFVFNPKSGAVEQVTKSKTADVRWPSRDEEGSIVYELDGELCVLDTKTRESRTLQITVPLDGLSLRSEVLSVGDSIGETGLSPKGERALFVARGDVFTAPIEKGVPRNLTQSSSAHDRTPRWSPDGSKIAIVSDRTGEEEIWVLAQDGRGTPEQLTKDGAGKRRIGMIWSPDGKRLAYHDQTGLVSILDVAAKTSVAVAKDGDGNAGDYSWSPDSALLAMSRGDGNGFRSLWIFSVTESKLQRVTSEAFNESEPVFDPEGRYLWYFSDRTFAPQISGVEWNFATNRTTGIFGMALSKSAKHPFAPESDEATIAKPGDSEPKKKDEDEKEKKEDSKPAPVVVDWEGLPARTFRVPVDAGNYSNLHCTKDALFWSNRAPFFYGRDAERKARLEIFDLKERKVSTLSEDVGGFSISSDGSKLIARDGGDIVRFDATAKGKDSRKVIATSGLLVDRNPKEEWNQIFYEVWRRFRDYFYVPNMHGYDWAALKDRYAKLLPHVAHRSDLNYVLGEMIAELNVSHAYVAGGDWMAPERPRVALPGARFELDAASGRYRIQGILSGQNEEDTYRSPLTEVGVDVKVSDYVLAIDGAPLVAPDNPYRLLRKRADRPVELLVNATPTLEGARTVVFRPISSEADLHYLAWVQRNRARVDELSKGRIGYIHVPDMGADGIREFIKWFYGQVRKDGLIVDMRNNGGGNVSSMILERLRRTLLGTEYSRNAENSGTYPQVLFHGPMACLLNENSASDGDIFPWMFKEAKLGPLIGKRSWGGVVGITDRGTLIDGGSVNVPEFGHADARGEWAVEGYGVDPDIVVENDPASILAGKDPQLERGVAEVQKALASRPSGLPPRPKDPIKTN